jgi:hypothetical protein
MGLLIRVDGRTGNNDARREVSRSCWTWRTCAAFGSLLITGFNVAWTAEIAIWRNKSKQRVYY